MIEKGPSLSEENSHTDIHK